MKKNKQKFIQVKKLRQAIRTALYMGFLVGTPALAAGGKPLVLEEILVTAEKRTQSMQDVPISISAMDQDALQKFQIDDIEDFGAKLANVEVNEYFGIATTFRSFIRGVGAVTVEVTQDPAVALYVDGIYVGSSFGGSFESSDLERVEVLRGPQGTLYGRNATGGAINLISKKPELGVSSFGQSFTVGNLGRFKSHTSANLPIGEKAALRLSALYNQRDGVVENTGLGEDYGVEDRTGLRMALKIAASENFEIDWSVESSQIEDTVKYSQVVSGTGNILNVPLGPPGAPTVDVFYPDPITDDRLDEGNSVFEVVPDDNTVLGSSLTLSWDINDNLELKSITGYRDVDATQYTQVTGTIQTFLNVPGVPFQIGPHQLGTGGIYELEFEQLTQEFQAVGDAEMFNGNVEYATGLYYYSDEGHNRDLSFGIGGQKATDTTDIENSSVAIYGQATFIPGDSPFRFTLGARYSRDQREALRTNLNVVPAFVDSEYDRDFSNFSPSFTVAYDVNDTVNVYAKVVTGYRSGGTSTLSFNEALFQQGADEETIVSYELGMKGEFMDNRLRLNTAIFSMDYKDYQGSIQTGPSPANRDNVNLGENSIQGFELDFTALISESLSFSMVAGYLDSEMGLDTFDPGAGAPATTLVDEMPYAPRLNYSLGLDYRMTVLDGLPLEGHLSYSYKDESESGIVAGTSNLNDSYAVVDANLTLSEIPFINGNLKLTLWGQNLMDEEYTLANIGPFAVFGAAGISPFGDPRTYGLTVSYDYN